MIMFNTEDPYFNSAYSDLLQEREELNLKLGNLTAFIENTEKFNEIEHIQQGLLLKQRIIMNAYLNVLDSRIVNWDSSVPL